MQGLGPLLVYSRPRAWVGQRFELPHLLKGVDVPLYARCLDLATGLGWATAGRFSGASLKRRPLALVRCGRSSPRTRRGSVDEHLCWREGSAESDFAFLVEPELFAQKR
jgi:hypothetical protein